MLHLVRLRLLYLTVKSVSNWCVIIIKIIDREVWLEFKDRNCGVAECGEKHAF